MSPLRQVRKRDGRLVPFDRAKIAEAIFRAAQSVGGEDRFLAEELAGVVVARLQAMLVERGSDAAPGIEDVQDLVERVLIDAGHARTSKAYILYRERRAAARAAPRADQPAASPPEARHAAASQPLAGEPREPTLDVSRGVSRGVSLRGAAHAHAALAAGGPLIGDESSLVRFSKGALVDRLLAEEALERPEAEATARAIEQRVLRAHAPRLTEELLDTLVRAELFERGWTRRALRTQRESLPARDIREAHEHGPTDRRAMDPAAVAESLGETLTAQHLLDHVLSPGVAEAHRLGDLHIGDLGAPLRLTAIAISAPEAAGRALAGELFSRAGGVQRAFAALEGLLLRYAPHAARALALEDVNVWLAPFVAHLGEDALGEAIRQFLLSPVFTAAQRRGGLLRLELGLTADVPLRLVALETPPPAPPGRRFGDYAEVAFHVTRMFLREIAALRRQGHWVDCAITLVLPRGGVRDASRRALVRQALAAAGEGGEPVILFEDTAAPSRGSRWLRLRERECPDPLRFDHGDVSAAGSVAINLVGAALRACAAADADETSAEAGPGAGGDRARERFIREVDDVVRLAVEAAASKRALLEGLADDPGAALYALRRGTHPLVDLESAFHLIELVGTDRAAALLVDARAAGQAEGQQARLEECTPSASSIRSDERVERLGMRERIVRHIHGRVREEALAQRLQASVAEGLSAEASSRFARADAQRYPRAAAWWGAEASQTAGSSATGGLPQPDYGVVRLAEPGLTREPLHPERLRGGPSLQRVRHRVGGEVRLPVDDLLSALEAAEQDAAVLEYAVDPWPRRVVHRGPSG